MHQRTWQLDALCVCEFSSVPESSLGHFMHVCHDTWESRDLGSVFSTQADGTVSTQQSFPGLGSLLEGIMRLAAHWTWPFAILASGGGNPCSLSIRLNDSECHSCGRTIMAITPHAWMWPVLWDFEKGQLNPLGARTVATTLPGTGRLACTPRNAQRPPGRCKAKVEHHQDRVDSQELQPQMRRHE
ncbi:hypothetical protein P7K49_027750 [Saguinus oedipus]|uniref:Reverse transcriptase zinc-binding domain-containing protein n=1 Tax=Saguinus oedipus TaxID=9490 RepID=A0ABQ9UCK7_SAGOE|nr:hypothetical protein P7K49_027750 [Saguinus oedipus]